MTLLPGASIAFSDRGRRPYIFPPTPDRLKATGENAGLPTVSQRRGLRACLETTRGAVFGEKAGWRGATKENIPGGSSTEEQRSQPAFSAKTLRAAGLLSVAGVGSFLTARCGALRAAKAALATAKIPRRSAPRSFQTGSWSQWPFRNPAAGPVPSAERGLQRPRPQGRFGGMLL